MLSTTSTLRPSILRDTLRVTLRLWLFNKAHTAEQWSLSFGHSSEGSEAIIWLGSIEINGGSGGGGWSIKTSSSCSPVKRFRSKLSTGTLHQCYTLWTTSHPTVKLCTAVSEWVVERGIPSPFDSCSRDYSDHWFSNLRKGGHMPLVPCTGSSTGASQQGWWHTTLSGLQR